MNADAGAGWRTESGLCNCPCAPVVAQPGWQQAQGGALEQESTAEVGLKAKGRLKQREKQMPVCEGEGSALPFQLTQRTQNRA